MQKRDTHYFSYHLFIAKVLVTSGFSFKHGQHSEVIGISADPDLALTCQELPQWNRVVNGGTGGLLDPNSIIICGGYSKFGKYYHSCWSLNEAGSFDYIQMRYPRNYASSVVLTFPNLVRNFI